MFNLASYLLGYTQEPAPSPVDPNVRLTAVPADDDWLLVEHGSTSSDSDSISSSLESIPMAVRRVHPLTRTSSTSSLPCSNIEESWFITPPPCFTSAGPVHMETSPLENLLIEHPSMSVYQHTRRRGSLPSAPSPVPEPQLQEMQEHVDERLREAMQERIERREQPRRQVDTLRQQERQCLKIKSAQKLQIHKACQSLKRGYIERNNKAREVNCRNHHQRRGERSQGSARSNANNNRKC